MKRERQQHPGFPTENARQRSNSLPRPAALANIQIDTNVKTTNTRRRRYGSLDMGIMRGGPNELRRYASEGCSEGFPKNEESSSTGCSSGLTVSPSINRRHNQPLSALSHVPINNKQFQHSGNEPDIAIRSHQSRGPTSLDINQNQQHQQHQHQQQEQNHQQHHLPPTFQLANGIEVNSHRGGQQNQFSRSVSLPLQEQKSNCNNSPQPHWAGGQSNTSHVHNVHNNNVTYMTINNMRNEHSDDREEYANNNHLNHTNVVSQHETDPEYDDFEDSFHADQDEFMSSNVHITAASVVLHGTPHRKSQVLKQDIEFVLKPTLGSRYGNCPLRRSNSMPMESISPSALLGRTDQLALCSTSGEPYLLGKGCSALVFLARHRTKGVLVACKKINVFDRNKRHQILSEIKALYYSTCPTIVRFYGAYYEQGSISILLEYMDRGTLKCVRKAAPQSHAPERVVAGIAFQLLWALAYLRHEKRLHRDVKPTNILVNRKGRVKLTDFGLSREVQNSIMQCASFVGSYKYMAPERVSNKEYSFASDLWAVGVVLYEFASGEYPFSIHGVNYFEVVRAVLESPSPQLPTKYFSAQGVALLGACMNKAPELRPRAGDLIKSSWFSDHGIVDVRSAASACAGWINSNSAVPIMTIDGQVVVSDDANL